MRGSELVLWRKANGYTQAELMEELGVKSRQTISSWENSENELPRLVHLALHALEHDPSCRRRLGNKATAKQRRKFFEKMS